MEILPPPAVKDADFRFRQFAVSQQLSAMKVGTDGVLLGAWAEAREGQILDIGTGTGLISLMLAQRTRQASVIGIDIDGWAVEEARMNAQRSPWKERLEMLHVSIEHYLKCCEENMYTFSVTKTCPKELDNKRNLNYQFIQIYYLSDDDINDLVKPTIDEIKDVLSNDINKTILRVREADGQMRLDEFMEMGEK